LKDWSWQQVAFAALATLIVPVALTRLAFATGILEALIAGAMYKAIAHTAETHALVAFLGAALPTLESVAPLLALTAVAGWDRAPLSCAVAGAALALIALAYPLVALPEYAQHADAFGPELMGVTKLLYASLGFAGFVTGLATAMSGRGPRSAAIVWVAAAILQFCTLGVMAWWMKIAWGMVFVWSPSSVAVYTSTSMVAVGWSALAVAFAIKGRS